jgi:hypothetical protein
MVVVDADTEVDTAASSEAGAVDSLDCGEGEEADGAVDSLVFSALIL